MANIEMTLRSQTWPFTFSMLDTCIKTAGLEYTLQGGHSLTFFAPSDDAFRLHSRSPYDLLKNVEELRKLLQYHLVPLQLSSADLKRYAVPRSREHMTTNAPHEQLPNGTKELELPTILQSPLILTISSPDVLMVQGIRVVQSDLEADNGVIHVIDGILWPPNMSEESFGLRRPSSYEGRIPGQEARS